ncbi:MAG: NAD(+) synthase [Muribaculaceae bacterium]
MINDFIRVSAVSPMVSAADVKTNVERILEMVREATASGADVVVTPEMSLTGYTCADLFNNELLLRAAREGIEEVARRSAGNGPLIFVGAPLVATSGSMYNCAVAIRGRVLGVVAKTYLPNYGEFYEKRWWAASPEPPSAAAEMVTIGGESYDLSPNKLFDIGGVKIGVEICEDLWVPVPPSSYLAMGGADIVVNLSASDDVIGKYAYLTSLLRQQSARCLCGYVYASAGAGESSTDLTFDGKTVIAENGTILASNGRWQPQSHIAVADIDIAALRHDRRHLRSFGDCARRSNLPAYSIVSAGACVTPDGAHKRLLRRVAKYPFVPSDGAALAERCEEIVNIQVGGLCQRLRATRCRALVVGISGGLDSTLALLVACRAFDVLGMPRAGIVGITMPGFGTTDRTHDNAVALMRALGVTMREICIDKAVRQHFADIGHDINNHDVTYENSQARERTQILMDVANQVGGMVLGTGDMSELALGWATYNGDHMSMYGVNAGVPKTLVRHLTRYFAGGVVSAEASRILLDIIDTPISPELLPADDEGNITQKTEDLVGPYELHDFFLYYMLRYGFGPRRIFMLACTAYEGDYDERTIAKWLGVFVRRFFAQQFKRSCLPDGPKVGSVSLSPRGDWRMPSDAASALWLAECDSLI